MSDTRNAHIQSLCGEMTRAASLGQLRGQRAQLMNQFVCGVADERPDWQQTVDVALDRAIAANARVLAVATLSQYFPDRCALVLLSLVVSRTEVMPVRVWAAPALSSLESLTTVSALLRAINDPAVDVPIAAAQTKAGLALDAKSMANNLRLLLCTNAALSNAGLRVLKTIWRDPDRYREGWFASAFALLTTDQDGAMLVEAATMAAGTAYSPAARVQALQFLYFLRKNARADYPFADEVWRFIRQIWARDGGDVRSLAGEILKLQGNRS